MYKDKDKQKEANRRASQKRRVKAKGMTEGMTNQGMTEESVTDGVIPYHIDRLRNHPLPPDLELCRTCREPLSKLEKPRKYPGMCLGCSTDRGGVFKDGMIPKQGAGL